MKKVLVVFAQCPYCGAWMQSEFSLRDMKKWTQIPAFIAKSPCPKCHEQVMVELATKTWTMERFEAETELGVKNGELRIRYTAEGP